MLSSLSLLLLLPLLLVNAENDGLVFQSPMMMTDDNGCDCFLNDHDHDEAVADFG